MLNNMSFWAWCAFVAIGLFTLVTWIFVIRYLHLGTWRITREGKTLLFMKICLAIICTVFFVFRFFLSAPQYLDFRSFIYTIIFLTMTWLMVLFNKYLVKQSNKEAEETVND